MFKVGLGVRCFEVGNHGVAIWLVTWAIPRGSGGACTVPG